MRHATGRNEGGEEAGCDSSGNAADVAYSRRLKYVCRRALHLSSWPTSARLTTAPGSLSSSTSSSSSSCQLPLLFGPVLGNAGPLNCEKQKKNETKTPRKIREEPIHLGFVPSLIRRNAWELHRACAGIYRPITTR